VDVIVVKPEPEIEESLPLAPLLGDAVLPLPPPPTVTVINVPFAVIEYLVSAEPPPPEDSLLKELL
jgi:hypothetical protein